MASTSVFPDALSSRLAALDMSEPLRTSTLDVQLALEVFSDPDASRSDLAEGYAYLDRLLLMSEADRKDEHIRTIAHILNEWLSETSLAELGKAFAALSPLVQTDLDAFAVMLNINAMESNIYDAGEAMTMEFKIFDEQEYTMAKKHFSSFISQAAGFGKTRPMARRLASLSNGWLAKRGKDTEEADEVRAAAAVASVKLRIPDEAPTMGSYASAPKASLSNDGDVTLLRDLTLKACEMQSTGLAFLVFEGIGLLTLKASARRILAGDETFVKAIILQAAHAYTRFSVAIILANLSAYHRPTSEEEETKERLRQYAKNAGQANKEEEKEESDEEMDERNTRLINMGIMQPVYIFAKSQAATMRRLAATILDALVQKHDLRGLIIQQGGAKALLAIIKQSGPSISQSAPPPEDLVAIQALAKLLITANPLLVLGSDASGLLDALKPLCTLITASSANLLQQFEATMALTNIASLSQELEDRIANLDGLLGRLEEIMLEAPSEPGRGPEGKTLCRRAATELLCNLVESDAVFVRYTAVDQIERLEDGKLPAIVGSRLHVLVMLSDVEDLPTRRAALGAIAQITHAPTASNFIASDEKRFDIIKSGAEDEDSGMRLRAIACLANVASNVAERREEIKQVLETLARSADHQVKESAAEALTQLAET